MSNERVNYNLILFLCYDFYGGNMSNNNFELDDRYNLFRTIDEIIHPTISKRNVSDYNIILEEYLYPIRVYYPKKVSNIKSVIIYIHGDTSITGCVGKYADICREIAVDTNRLVIAIDYLKESNLTYPEFYEKMYLNLTYLYKEFEDSGILFDDICLMGDSTGGNICYAMNMFSLERGDFKINKSILFYPTLSLDYGKDTKINYIDNNDNKLFLKKLNKYYKNFCNNEVNKYLSPFIEDNYKELSDTLVFSVRTDVLKEEDFKYYEGLHKYNKGKYVELSFCDHGFLNNMSKEIKNEVFKQIKEFLN